MVFLKDIDFTEDRWAVGDLSTNELWEKIELRLKRKRKRWIIFTVILFMILSAVPIVLDQTEKWKTRHYIRKFSEEINSVKKQAILAQKSYRISLLQDGSLGYKVEELSQCDGPVLSMIRQDHLIQNPEQLEKYLWIFPAQGERLHLHQIQTEFCYDAFRGSFLSLNGTELNGFGVIPVKDLSEDRVDRASFLILSGLSAEISFD